jgi:hypothetical protein
MPPHNPAVSLARPDADGSGRTLRQDLTRSVAAEFGAVRPLHHTTVRAHRISESGVAYGVNETWHSLADALAGLPIVTALNHKEHVILREEGPRGIRIHVYRVKQRSRARYVHREHVTRAVRDLYLDPVCNFDGGIVG